MSEWIQWIQGVAKVAFGSFGAGKGWGWAESGGGEALAARPDF